jgi:hypothetical protein
MQIVNRKSEIVNGEWLPDMDLNHDKQIQSLLCYRYTIGQAGALEKLKGLMSQSSRQTSAELQGDRTVPSGLVCQPGCFPALKRRAILKMSLRDKGKRHSQIPNRNS